MILIKLFKIENCCKKFAMCKLLSETGDKLSSVEIKKYIDLLDSFDSFIHVELHSLEYALHFCNEVGLYGYGIEVEKINHIKYE